MALLWTLFKPNGFSLFVSKETIAVAPGIQTRMVHFSIIWQGSPNIAHLQLKGTWNNNKQIILFLCCNCCKMIGQLSLATIEWRFWLLKSYSSAWYSLAFKVVFSPFFIWYQEIIHPVVVPIPMNTGVKESATNGTKERWSPMKCSLYEEWPSLHN